METPDKPEKRKRRWQFSLRVLLVFATLVSMGFGWLGWKLERGWRMAAAIDQLEQYGVASCEFPSDTPYPNDDSGIRAIYRRLLLACTDYDPYGPVVSIWFHFQDNTQPNDALPLLVKFDSLTDLMLSGPDLTDRVLLAVPNPSTLRRLQLERCNITDSGLAGLERFSGLTDLDLRYMNVNGSGLAVLEKMPRLRNLDFSGSTIDDAAMQIIAIRCPQLHELSLDKTAVTDAGLKILSGLNELEVISLPSATSDSGLKWVARLPMLKTLSCAIREDAPGITDAGLGELRRLERLKVLWLGNTSVTVQGFSQLRQLPEFEELFFALPENSPRIDLLRIEKLLPHVNVNCR